MALKIGGPRRPAVEEELPEEELPLEFEEETPEEAPVEEEMVEEAPEEMPDEEPEVEDEGGTLDPALAGYLGPESGPFKCGNCAFFSPLAPNTCEYVAGVIDEEGCCNLFKTAEQATDEEPEVPFDEFVEESMEGEEEIPAEEEVTEEY